MFASMLRVPRWLVVAVLLFVGAMNSARAEVLLSCSFSPGTTAAGDLISRGVYLTDFPGQSLRSVKLRHSAQIAGPYLITLTARRGSFDGPIIGEPYTASVTLSGDNGNGVDVTYELGDEPVVPGSTVALAVTATGPGSSVYFDVGSQTNCNHVVETESTQPPLSSVRANRLGVEVRGRAVTQTFYSCPFGSGGDRIARGLYITNYPGETLRKVKLRYSSDSTGAATVRITARQDAFNGSVIGEAQTKSLSFASGAQEIEWDFGGALVKKGSTITFTQEVLSSSAGNVYFANAASGSCPGVVETDGTDAPLDTVRGTRGIQVTGDREAGYRNVVEYFVPALNHYFVSGRPNEQALLDRYPTLYQRTGAAFVGFPASGAPQGSLPICRFYLPPNLGGSNSHFYGQPSDCTLITNTGNPMFVFEGYDFALYPPLNGACPSYAPNKVYRSFNNRVAQNDGNHRYTTTIAAYNAMTAQGWVAEGAVFCSAKTTP